MYEHQGALYRFVATLFRFSLLCSRLYVTVLHIRVVFEKGQLRAVLPLRDGVNWRWIRTVILAVNGDVGEVIFTSESRYILSVIQQNQTPYICTHLFSPIFWVL